MSLKQGFGQRGLGAQGFGQFGAEVQSGRASHKASSPQQHPVNRITGMIQSARKEFAFFIETFSMICNILFLPSLPFLSLIALDILRHL
jgi:hypothetical protein